MENGVNGQKMINYGKIFEIKLANLLAAEKIPFTKEDTKRRYGGGNIAKGKFDFKIGDKMCLELKSIGTGSNLRLPWPNAKNTPIKTHQLRALRQEMLRGKLAGLLVEIRDMREYFMLTMSQLDEIVYSKGMIKALTSELLSEFGIRIDGELKEIMKIYRGLEE